MSDTSFNTPTFQKSDTSRGNTRDGVRADNHQPGLDLYLVTDRELCGSRGLVDTVRQAVDGGVTFVQLRDKVADLADHLRQLEALAQVIDGRATLVVNDRLDVAIAAQERGIPVDGLHLGQADATVLRAREALGADATIGLSANTLEHLAAVSLLPAQTVDYLGVGVIRPTMTKTDHPPVLGIDGFATFAASVALPCVAIGGIQLADTAPLRRAGAAGVAVVSALCAASDPRAAAAEFVAAWQGAQR